MLLNINRTKKGGENISNKKLKTGEKAPESGQYRVIGENREVTMVKGNKLPPSKSEYRLVDKTKHKK